MTKQPFLVSFCLNYLCHLLSNSTVIVCFILFFFLVWDHRRYTWFAWALGIEASINLVVLPRFWLWDSQEILVEIKCPPHVMQVIEEELTKLQLLEASSSEFNVTRNYLDWLTALPWGNYRYFNFSFGRQDIFWCLWNFIVVLLF